MTDPVTRGSRLSIVFTHHEPGGLAVGRVGRVEVRVPGGIYGERALVEIQHVSPHRPWAWAELLRLEEPSPGRVLQPGGDGHQCPGCGWSHMDQATQLRAKGETLRGLAQRVGVASELLSSPLVEPSPRPQGYRNRGKYVLARKHGKVVLGGYRPRSHVVASTLGCPVMEPVVDDAARAVAVALGHRRWSIFDETQGHGWLRHAAIRANGRGEVLLTLVVTRLVERPWKDLARELRRRIPGLVGVTLDVNPGPGNVIFSGQTERIWGSGELVERYGEAVVRLAGHTFGQVNREAAALLFDHAATKALAPLPPGLVRPQRVWDLFCGAGALTQTLARRSVARAGGGEEGPELLGVERDEEAVRLAAGAARSAGLTRCRYLAADANGLLAEEKDLPQVVVLNPPRTGCRPELLRRICQHRIPRVVYVSCSAETLARDLMTLAEGGLRARSLRGFDLMPLTPHLELVAVLEREDPQVT